MSNTVYRVDTTYKQYEIARLIERLDKGIVTHETRLNEIENKTRSLPPIAPHKKIDIPKDNPSIGHFTRMMDITPQKGLINENASRFSQQLERSIETITIEPINIIKEEELSENEKFSLAEVRIKTNEVIHNLLKGHKMGEVTISGFRLLKQDGNIYDVQTELPKEEGGVVRSKVCVSPNGTFTIHQIGEYPSGACEKVAKRIAGTVNLALDRVYAEHFSTCFENREAVGQGIVGRKMISVERTMCG